MNNKDTRNRVPIFFSPLPPRRDVGVFSGGLGIVESWVGQTGLINLTPPPISYRDTGKDQPKR